MIIRSGSGIQGLSVIYLKDIPVQRPLLFSQDGKKIVSCSLDSTIRIWDIEKLGNIAVDQQLVCGFQDQSKWNEGWALSNNGELLWWVPGIEKDCGGLEILP
jgi:WD40 repeat protein